MIQINYTFYEIIWIFISYAFLGWCAEVIYAASIKGKYINRGFNTGPVCPIYGIGMLSVLLFLEGIKDNLPLLFFSSIIFTSVIEFLVGFVLEKLFHEKWWDYTNEPFNIKGYICFRFSILWGLACVFVINLVHPAVMKIIRFIPHKIGTVILVLLGCTFAADFTVTLINVLKIKKNLKAIADIENRLEKLSEAIGKNLSNSTISIKEKGDELKLFIDEKEMDFELFKAELAERFPNNTEMESNIIESFSKAERLGENFSFHIDELKRRSKHIRHAFPNLFNGKYNHIFKK